LVDCPITPTPLVEFPLTPNEPPELVSRPETPLPDESEVLPARPVPLLVVIEVVDDAVFASPRRQLPPVSAEAG
jgi:hypothetical protein